MSKWFTPIQDYRRSYGPAFRCASHKPINHRSIVIDKNLRNRQLLKASRFEVGSRFHWVYFASTKHGRPL